MTIPQKNINVINLIKILNAKIQSLEEGNKKIGLEIQQMRETAVKFKDFTQEELEKYGIKVGFDATFKKLAQQIKTPTQLSSQISFIENQKEILNNLTDEELKFLEIDENGNTIFHRNFNQIENLTKLLNSFESDKKLDMLKLVNNELISPVFQLAKSLITLSDFNFFITNNLVNSNPIDIEGNNIFHFLSQKTSISNILLKQFIDISLKNSPSFLEGNFFGISPISLMVKNKQSFTDYMLKECFPKEKLPFEQWIKQIKDNASKLNVAPASTDEQPLDGVFPQSASTTDSSEVLEMKALGEIELD